MNERIQGRGELESWESPGNRSQVDYVFDITTDFLSRPGFPRVATRKHSMGKITTLTGEAIASGYYRLFASDGEILKVENLGMGEWVILAS